MILPIYAFGQPVLKKKAASIPEDYANMEQLVSNMWETMYYANGVGLAGPQVGLGLRIFMVDTIQIMDDDKNISSSIIMKVVKIFSAPCRSSESFEIKMKK